MPEANAAPTGLEQARETLQRIWGYPNFRPGQAEIIEAVHAGQNVLAIMPTGGGKSLCYQLPALLRPGLTVVVSPLIALMQDQVAALRALGVNAGALTSANDPEENARVRGALEEGTLKLLYCAPERLSIPETAQLLRRSGVGLLAVDEAHCVAQWGHDFRPDYLQIGALRAALDTPQHPMQLAAFTATADEATRNEIIEKLFTGADAPRAFLHGFDRPNLRLAFEPKRSARQRITKFVLSHPGQAGIVYCASRKGVEAMAEHLQSQGVRALPYHAGLPPETRAENQRVFVHEDGVVMAATVAFGMGVDKPDVRFVAHADLPKSVEAYYQEIGRAGRDGLKADTLTLYGLDDMKFRRRQIDEAGAPDERKRADHLRFNALLALAEAPTCRRQTLLAYFEEELPAPCGACDLCENPPQKFDGLVPAQKALSAILRTGQRFGLEHLIAVLLGDATDNVLKFGHQTLPTFGCGKEFSKTEWRAIFRQLYAAGYADVDVSDYGQWRATQAARAVLKGEAKVELRKDSMPKRARERTRASANAPELSENDNLLLKELKAMRLSLAKAANSPAYVIFTDRTLIEIAANRPQNLDELSQLHGVGEAKLRKFGAEVLKIVSAA